MSGGLQLGEADDAWIALRLFYGLACVSAVKMQIR
jgi:hypothetical protein